MATKVTRKKHIDVNDRIKLGAKLAVLAVAEQGVTLAVPLAPTDSGGLKQSIHAVKTSEYTAIYGTNLEYGPYVEFGTGKHAERGGRKTPWVYYSEKVQKFFRTSGMKAQPYLRPSADRLNKKGSRTFAKIMKGVLKRG